MNVLLVDIDSTIPNLALMKLSSYWKERANVDIVKCSVNYYPRKKKPIHKIDASRYDKVFASTIFSNTSQYVQIEGCPYIQYGGSGIDYLNKLPPEVESCSYDYSIYPDNDTSYGFLTRGCIRNCSFCIVPKKEGALHKYNTLDQIIKHDKVKFLDNNFLAWDGHKEILRELVQRKTHCQFNQGLDLRLIDDENASLLSQLHYIGEYIFAFDNKAYEPIIEKQLKIIKKYIPADWRIKFFIYCSPEMSIKDDVMYRVEKCREWKVLPYLMRHLSCWGTENEPFYNQYAAWCNQPGLFKSMPFEEFVHKRTCNEKRITQIQISMKD